MGDPGEKQRTPRPDVSPAPLDGQGPKLVAAAKFMREMFAPTIYFSRREVGDCDHYRIEEYLIAEFGLSVDEANSLLLPQVVCLMRHRHELRTAATDLQREDVLTRISEGARVFAGLGSETPGGRAFLKALRSFPTPRGGSGVVSAGAPVGPRPSGNDDRDRWIYQECREGAPYKQVIAQLRDRSEWEPIESAQGIRAAAKRYAERMGLPPPPRRKAN